MTPTSPKPRASKLSFRLKKYTRLVGLVGISIITQVFIVGPDKKLKLSMLYPATTGRNFDEIYRVVLSLQLTAEKKVATPANWKSGERCMVVPSVKAEEVPKLFPKGVEIKAVPSGKQYLRFTPDPS